MRIDHVDFPAVTPLSADEVTRFVWELSASGAGENKELLESFQSLSWQTQAVARWLYEQHVVRAISLGVALQSDTPDVVFRAALMLVEYAATVYPYLLDEYRTGDLLACSSDVVWASLWHAERVGTPLVLGTTEWLRAAGGVLCFMTSCGEEHLADVEDAGDGMGIVGIASDGIAEFVMSHPALGHRVGEFMKVRRLSNTQSDAAFVVGHFRESSGSPVAEGKL